MGRGVCRRLPKGAVGVGSLVERRPGLSHKWPLSGYLTQPMSGSLTGGSMGEGGASEMRMGGRKVALLQAVISGMQAAMCWRKVYLQVEWGPDQQSRNRVRQAVIWKHSRQSTVTLSHCHCMHVCDACTNAIYAMHTCDQLYIEHH